VIVARACTAKDPHVLWASDSISGAASILGTTAASPFSPLPSSAASAVITTDPSLAKVTAVCASAHPSSSALVPKVIAVPARIDPGRTLFAPRVAAVPSAHITFSALAPFFRMNFVPAAVTRVLRAWKRKTGFSSLRPSSVTVPAAKLMALPDRYVPGVNVTPPISIAIAFPSGRTTIAAV